MENLLSFTPCHQVPFTDFSLSEAPCYIIKIEQMCNEVTKKGLQSSVFIIPEGQFDAAETHANHMSTTHFKSLKTAQKYTFKKLTVAGFFFLSLLCILADYICDQMAVTQNH